MVHNKLGLTRKKRLLSSGLLISGSILMSSLTGCGSGTTETTVLNPTQGVITEIEEMSNGEYLITNETIVSRKEDSRIIASYLDGTRDTLTLEQANLEESESSSSSTHRRRGMSPILMGGMMGYMMGKNMSTPVSRNAYKSSSVYNRSSSSTSTLKSSATRQTVSRPRTGFGSSGGSTRSSGG